MFSFKIDQNNHSLGFVLGQHNLFPPFLLDLRILLDLTQIFVCPAEFCDEISRYISPHTCC